MCGRKCLQWSIVVFNTLSVIIGILAIVACIFEMEKYNANTKEHTEQIVQLIAGCVLVISAFVGCFGAVNGSFKVLCAFIVFLTVLIGSHIWKLSRYDEQGHMNFTKSMVEYQWLQELLKTGSMDVLQTTYNCCGKSSYTDYTSMKLPVPASCYLVENGLTSIYPYAEGCERSVSRAYVQVYHYEKWTHILLIAFEVTGILLSVVLILKLTLKSRKYLY